jgi:uncharacterized protein (DUF2147 family)
MKKLAVWFLLLTPLAHADPEAVMGRWASDRSVIEISVAGDHLSVIVVALKNPVYTAEETAGPVGAIRVDANNPDPSMRERPVLGMELVSGYTYTGKRWEGDIYDPESGNTYSSRMSVNDDGNLAMRGYIGAPMFGRTSIFVPVSQCTEVIVDMLVMADLPTCTAAGD